MAAHALDLAPFWVRLLAGVVAGALTWFVALDIGSAIAARLVIFSHPGSRLGIGAATGYALIGSIVALLGCIGGINRFTMWGVLACAVVIRSNVYLNHARRAGTFIQEARAWFGRQDASSRAACLVIVLAVITGVVNAALPAVWWDPVAYHLPIVANALRQGLFVFDPQMVQTGFPLLGEAAALPAYALAGSAGAAFATLGAGLCIGALVWGLADWIRPGCGAFAAMLALSSALWAWLAPSFYVDVPFAMFVLAALLAALVPRSGGYDYSEKENTDASAIGMLAGVLCGAAAAVKYSGLGATVIVAFVALWSVRADRAKMFLSLCTGFALVAAGWYARSWLLTGDPLYPFLSAALSHTASMRDFAVRYVTMTKHWCGGGTSATDLIVLPYRLVASPKSFCGDPGLTLRVAIIFAAAAVLLVRHARVITIAIVALTLFWFGTSQQWRFLLPALFLYCAVAAAGVWAGTERLRIWGSLGLSALAAFVVIANWTPLGRSQASASLVPAFSYIRGTQDAGGYLDTRLESFAAARWLAGFGIDGSQIVALDDVRDYYMPAGTVWGNPYYQQALALDWSAPPKRRYEPLLQRGKIYLVVNANAAYLQRTPTGVDWAVFAADQKRGMHELFSDSEVTVFDISEVH